MNAEENAEIITEDKQKYEIIQWEGEEARFYPKTGAVMVEEASGRLKIVANRGWGNNFHPTEFVEKRVVKRKEAILAGLEEAAWEMDLKTANEMLSAVVAARAKNAVEDEGRTGNADAKFIFGLVSAGDEDGGGGPAVRIDMDKEAATELIKRLVDI